MAETALSTIRSVDYTVLYVRNMPAMRTFYEVIMGFPFQRALGDGWLEYKVGSNTLVLAHPQATFAAKDPSLPIGAAAMQLAFRVAPRDVERCATELAAKGVPILSPPTDQPFGHKTLFFRDPDGNVIEIYAEI
jgi:catechol 2,3-dioxygenase-like lactoylglutathione lyase family enzyme